MSRSQMALQRLELEAAFQAGNLIILHRLLDWHGWFLWFYRCDCGAPRFQMIERLVNVDDQLRKIADWHDIVADIRSNNPSCEIYRCLVTIPLAEVFHQHLAVGSFCNGADVFHKKPDR